MAVTLSMVIGTMPRAQNSQTRLNRFTHPKDDSNATSGDYTIGDSARWHSKGHALKLQRLHYCAIGYTHASSGSRPKPRRSS